MEKYIDKRSTQPNYKTFELSMMRILWFSNTPANGIEYFRTDLKGTGGWLQSLDKALQESVDLHVAFYYPHDISSFQHKKALYYPIARGAFFVELLKKNFFHFEPDKQDLPLYLELVNKIKPDLIHIHGTENPFGCIINQVDIPVIVSIQGNLTVILHKYFSGLERKYLGTRKNDFSHLKSFFLQDTFKSNYKRLMKMQRRELRNLQNCNYIMGRTEWDRRITRVLAPKSTYFYNDEILRDQFYEVQWVPKKRQKIIVHTTNSNNFYKGFETLCQALRLLLDRGCEVEWRVAGISEHDLIVKIAKKALKTDYPEKGLSLLGKLDAYDLVSCMIESDMYVMTSHIENSSNGLCEAMLLGMPCIATFAGGTGSLLKDGKEGILIQDGDPWAMAGAVLELIHNQDQAALYGRNAKARAQARHDKKTITNGCVSIYDHVLDLHRSVNNAQQNFKCQYQL